MKTKSTPKNIELQSELSPRLLLTYGDISEPRFIEAIKALLEVDLKMNQVILIKNLIDLINTNVKIFHDVRNSLIKKYGILTEDGKNYTLMGATEDNIILFQEKNLELIQTSFETNFQEKILLNKDTTIKGIHGILLSKLIDVAS